MEKWKIHELADLCDITSSKRIYANELVAAGVPFLKSKEIIEKVNGQVHSELLFISEERYVQLVQQYGSITPGDILLTSRGTLGVPYMVKFSDKFHFADGNLTWFRNFNNLDSSFLKYFFISPNGKAELQKCVIGSSQLAYTISSLKKIKIPLPPLPVQRRIAGILSAYDDLIENNQRRIAILERMARALYREWFVHFRYPGHEGVPLVDSPLGPIPQGWEVCTLGDLINIRKGKNITRNTIQNGNIPVIAGGISPAYFHDTANTQSPVITISASGANAGFVNIHYTDIWASDCSYIDLSTTQHVFYYYLWLDFRRTNITHLQRGSAQPHVYPKDLASLEATRVPNELLVHFNQVVKPLFMLIDKLDNQTQNLRRTRDLLLPRLLSGQLDVGELDDA